MAVAAPARPPRAHGWGSEFEWTPEARAAHDEAMGWKAEAKRIKQEYEANGFRL